MARTVEDKARGKALTFAELEAFVEHARNAGVQPEAVISGTVTFGAKVKALKVTVDTTPPLTP